MVEAHREVSLWAQTVINAKTFMEQNTQQVTVENKSRFILT